MARMRDTPCGKWVYERKREAKQVIRRMRHKPGVRDHGGLHAYRCDTCGGYHIGHRMKVLAVLNSIGEQEQCRLSQ